jgi:hypothetical protein
MVVKRVAARATVRMEISMMGNGSGFWLRGCEYKFGWPRLAFDVVHQLFNHAKTCDGVEGCNVAVALL